MNYVKITCILPQKERKSNILSLGKKALLKRKPGRVRFADGVVVNGSPLYSPSMEKNIIKSTHGNSYVPVNECEEGFAPPFASIDQQNNYTGAFEHLNIPLIPNVLKVFLENGQTKTFKYDSSTTVQVSCE